MPYKDPEKAKANKKEYYQKNKVKMDASTKQWQKDHPEIHIQRCNRYAQTQAGKESLRKRGEKYRKTAKGKAAQKRYSQTKTRKIYLKEWLQSESGKESTLKAHLLCHYGITPDDYRRMLREQKGLCAICGKSEKNMHIDHDHETGKVRGIICVSCNHMLGRAYDDIDILLNAVQYLRKNRELKTNTYITPV